LCNAEPAVSPKLKEDSIQSPIKDVKEEPESIVVEPNLHLEENDGNRFEIFIVFQSREIGHFNLNCTICIVASLCLLHIVCDTWFTDKADSEPIAFAVITHHNRMLTLW
jgi:hypothetical protein